MAITRNQTTKMITSLNSSLRTDVHSKHQADSETEIEAKHLKCISDVEPKTITINRSDKRAKEEYVKQVLKQLSVTNNRLIFARLYQWYYDNSAKIHDIPLFAFDKHRQLEKQINGCNNANGNNPGVYNEGYVAAISDFVLLYGPIFHAELFGVMKSIHILKNVSSCEKQNGVGFGLGYPGWVCVEMLTEKELDLWREVFSLIKKDVGDLQVLNPNTKVMGTILMI
ncbi:unnamed protein product [Ambrosiozyma monospora]|uniref:Unnamed protein product n=1 Tax=Ambrosiozyma monospora TaxID=43982 RepID=A0A9W7DDH7_AMBMO|nr:unnamed protein product [Ambrosiozyma monospora]